MLACSLAQAQNKPMTPEEEEKAFYKQIDEMIERYTVSLNLEDWQIFYTDSILVHNLTAKKEEFKKLRDSKVSNLELYTQADDKWEEATYVAFRKILNEDQWIKYNKRGAAKAKKERDKRLQKKI